MKLKFSLFGLCIVLVLLSVQATAAITYESFYVSLDSQGDVTVGGGSGYNGGDWYYYENTDWWNQWFYDGVYDPDRSKVITIYATIDPLETGPGSVELVVNWSSDTYPDGTGEPPLPPLTQPQEDDWIVRSELLYSNAAITVAETIETTLTIDNYNPEWVSVDIRGANVEMLYGVIAHECVPEPTSIAVFGMAAGFLSLIRKRRKV